jgi:hypothetical protein
MENSKQKIIILFIFVLIAYLLPWIIIGTIYAMQYGFDLNDMNNVQYLISLIVSTLAIATSFHLWSRLPELEGNLKRLFLLTGFTFIAILVLFSYLLIDISLEWFGLLSIADFLNQNIADVTFNYFGIEGWRITMPADSFLTFALMVFAVILYLYPMEKYVKLSKPWHTISLLVCLAIIPILLLFVPREFPGATYVMSILTTVIILWVLYNFVFLFYLYFSTGLQSPKGTAMRKASFMIGIGLLLIIITWIAGWAINTGISMVDFAIQMSFGGLGIFLFNYGFYLIRPE